MLPRISAFVVIVVAVVASARMERRLHIRRSGDGASSQCDTGEIKCCNSVFNASDLSSILDMLSYSYNPTDTVGIDCTPFNIYGAGEAAACQQQPVCCSNTNYTGVINVGCSPFDFD